MTDHRHGPHGDRFRTLPELTNLPARPACYSRATSGLRGTGPGRAAAVFPLEHGKVSLPSRFATNQQPAAAKVLSTLLDKLRSSSSYGRRGGLQLVRAMTDKNGA